MKTFLCEIKKDGVVRKSLVKSESREKAIADLIEGGCEVLSCVEHVIEVK